MCGGLFACGRGMIMVGLMVALVGTVNGAGAGKGGTPTGVSSLLEALAKKGQKDSSQLEGRQVNPNKPVDCPQFSNPKFREDFLADSPNYSVEGKFYPRQNWERALEECCPVRGGSQGCTVKTLGEKVARDQTNLGNGVGNGGGSGQGDGNGGGSGEGGTNGVPPGKGPLTLGIILLIALIPLIPFF